MSCFSCSKSMKMVEDPLKNAANKASEVIQDISGMVVECKEVVQDISGIAVEVDEAVRERSPTLFNVVEKVMANMSDDAKKEADKKKIE